MTRNERELLRMLADAADKIDELERRMLEAGALIGLELADLERVKSHGATEKVESLERDLEMCRARINALLADRDRCRDEITRLRLQIAEMGGSPDGR